jgi:hypothetical protein
MPSTIIQSPSLNDSSLSEKKYRIYVQWRGGVKALSRIVVTASA